MTTLTARVPAGATDGGQFAATPRTEPDVDLAAQSSVTARAEELGALADDLFYGPAGPDERDLGAAREEARGVLGDLAIEDFEDRWSDVVTAARWHARFADEQDGFTLAAAGPLTEEESCGVELEDFTEINASYQPGEDGYFGFDFRAYADAIASAWGQARYVRVRDAVRANDKARARSHP